MSRPDFVTLKASDKSWPRCLRERLGDSAPMTMQTVGPVSLLAARKTALFCSAKTPGRAILRAHDAAARMRDKGTTVISGFQSPIEKQCLRILLRGKQPIIVCLARAFGAFRIPADSHSAFDAGRVLFLSPFIKQPNRVTKASALRRNEVVAALADDAYVAHAAAGGQTQAIVDLLKRWGVPIL